MIKSDSHATNKLASVTIHNAAPEDASAIAELSKQLAEHESMHSLADAGTFKRLISEPEIDEVKLFVAKSDNAVIGFALIYPGYDLSTDSYGYHLADVCVEEGLRNQGVGKKMMSHIANHIILSQRNWLSLTALQQNNEAVAFYNSLGLLEVPVRFMAAGGQVLSSIAS